MHAVISGWGAIGGGLDRFDERSGEFKHYRHSPGDPHSLMTNEVVSIYGDPSGHLWVGEFGGVSRFDPATGRFTNFRPGPIGSTSLAYTVSAFHRDRSGTLWLGTWGGVLSRFDEKTNTFVNYTPDLRDPRRFRAAASAPFTKTGPEPCGWPPDRACTRMTGRTNLHPLHGNPRPAHRRHHGHSRRWRRQALDQHQKRDIPVRSSDENISKLRRFRRPA